MPSSFSDLIFQKRLEQGLSQEQMARKLNTTRMTIYRWEQGLSTPSPAFWNRLSALLNYQVETFFSSDGTPRESITVPSEESSQPSEILFEQQLLVLAEQRMAFHRDYLQYARELVEILLPSLYPNASQNLRLRLLEYLFRQIEQTRPETYLEFVPLSFSQVKDILEHFNQEDIQSIELHVDDHHEEKKKVDTYADRLREERLLRNWTQKDVADRINLPDARTVGRWERGITFPSPYYCRELVRVFGKTPEELGLMRQQQARESPPSEAFNALPENFGFFVGRRKEVATASSLLRQADVRLLTLLGSGGIGKTRLGIEVARQVRDYFEDGICYVPLTTLHDPAEVLPTIAAALGIQDNFSHALEKQIKAFLSEKKILLLLDNFEHLTNTAPLIEKLLQECPQIKVLVTSRHVLQLEVEHTFFVPPLSLPDLKAFPATENLLQYTAIALFVQCVRTHNFSFKITDDNARAIAELCVHLDGLPLAIELAAARIKLLSPQTLLERFLQDQQVLKSELSSIPERHRTLYYTIQWSYDLLNEQEQWLFRHLSLFIGDLSIATIEAFFVYIMPESSGIIMEIVSSLFNKSLLQRSEEVHGEPRFFMLETIRTYALDALREKGELEGHRRVYALYYLALVEQAAPFLKNMQQVVWLAKMDQELDNIRAALQWLIERKETDLALRFTEAFGKFCGLRGYWHEEQRLLDTVLQLPPTQEQGIRGRVLRRAGHLVYRLRDLAQARTLLEKSVACSRKVGDWQNLVGALSSLSWVFYRQNELDTAYELLKECVAISSFTNDAWVRANALESLGRFMHYQGQLDEAYTLLQESVAIAHDHLDKESHARILTTLAHLEVSRGKKEQAMQLAQESFLLARELNTRPLIALTLGTLGTVAFMQGDYTLAQQHFEDRSAIAEELGDLPTIAHIQLDLADIALATKDLMRAAQLVKENYKLVKNLDDASDPIMVQSILGDLQYLDNDFVQAAEFYRKGLQHYNASVDKRKAGRCLMGLARISLAHTIPERATYLLGAATSYLKPYDMYPMQSTDFQHTIEHLHILLDDADFAHAWREGSTASLEEIMSKI